jgi:hypothetical protein
MATNPITLIDGDVAYATDVETKVNPLYSDLDSSNFSATAYTGTANGKIVLQDSPTLTGVVTITSTTTTGVALQINANSLTSGKGLSVYSNSSSTTARNIAEVIQDHASASNSIALYVQQDAASTGLKLLQSGNGKAIDIIGSNTTANAINLVCDSLTSGGCAYFSSNSSDTTARNLVSVIQDHASASNSIALYVQQDAASTGLKLLQSGNGKAIDIIGSNTTANAINLVCDSLTSGAVLYVYSNSSSSTSRNLAEIVNDNTSATSTNCLKIQQDASNYAIVITTNSASSSIRFNGSKNVAGNHADILGETTNSSGLSQVAFAELANNYSYAFNFTSTNGTDSICRTATAVSTVVRIITIYDKRTGSTLYIPAYSGFTA